MLESLMAQFKLAGTAYESTTSETLSSETAEPALVSTSFEGKY